MEQLYNNGVDALNAKRYASAGDQFDAVAAELSVLHLGGERPVDAGLPQYLQNNYTDAIGTLDQFIQLHPAHRDIAYAYYLRALCYYEQIADIQRDQKGTQEAMNALQEVVNRFPDTAYARDAQLKIDLCRDHLAGKEMEIGRWYQKQHFYEAAIGRFQRVVDDYQTTNHVPEALARLTEIYLVLGLQDEAKRTAAVLGYNYPGSDWYADTYDQLHDDGLVQGVPPPRGGSGGASSRAPGTRCSDSAGGGDSIAHRAVDPRRGADRAAGPGVRPRPDRADRRDRRRQIDPAGQSGPGAGRAGRGRPGARRRRAGQRHRVLRAAAGPSGRRRCWTSRGWRPRTTIVLRRMVGRDGRSRAFVNDQPVGVALLRRAGALLVEVQGQHEQMGLADPASHAGLLDAFGVPAALRQRGARGVARTGARRWRRWTPRARRSPPPSATRTGCATRSTNWPRWRRARRGGAAGRRAPAPAAGRAPGRGDRRRPGGDRPARPAQRRPGRGVARGVAGAAAAGRAGRRPRRTIRRRRRWPRWNGPRKRWPRRKPC